MSEMSLLLQPWPYLIVVGFPLVTGVVSSFVHYRRGDL